MRIREATIEQELIEKLGELKYTLRPDIRSRGREKRGLASHAEELAALRDKRSVLIFDECHRSQFGVTGTPIFRDVENAPPAKGEYGAAGRGLLHAAQ